MNGEKELYKFLAGPFEMTAKEIEDLDISVFFEFIKQLSAENNLSGFFRSAASIEVTELYDLLAAQIRNC